MRIFETGATRDKDDTKLDFEGFLSPLTLEAFAEYMNKNRVQADGNLRDSDNWQKGIPADAYMKSGWRHFFDWWKAHRAGKPELVQEAICGLLFNAMGYLHEHLKTQHKEKANGVRTKPRWRRAEADPLRPKDRGRNGGTTGPRKQRAPNRSNPIFRAF